MAKRFLMWVLCSAFVGVFCLTFIPTSYHWIVLAVLSLALVVLSILKYRLKVTAIACLIAAICSMSIFCFLNNSADKLVNTLLDQTVTIQGKITDIGSNSAQNLSRYKVRVESIESKKLPAYSSFYVYIYSDDSAFCPGDTLCGPIDFFETPIEYGAGKEHCIFIAGYQEGESLQVDKPRDFEFYKIINEFRESIKGFR